MGREVGEHRHLPALAAQHGPPHGVGVGRRTRRRGRPATTSHAPSASSASSWPPPQPEYPAKNRMPSMPAATSSGSRWRSIVPTSPSTLVQPGANMSSASARRRRRPRARTPFCSTGPPMYSTGGLAASDDHSPSTASTSSSVGRFSTTPSAPSGVCSIMSTTVRSKLGSLQHRLGDEELAHRAVVRCHRCPAWRVGGPTRSPTGSVLGFFSDAPIRAGVRARRATLVTA